MPHAPTALRLLLIMGDAALGNDVAGLLGTRLPEAALLQASTLQAGLDRLAAGGVDLVLLDLDLPEGGGLAAVARVREQDADAALVLLAGPGDEERTLQAMRMGVQDCLRKEALDGDAWASAIRNTLARANWLTARIKRSSQVMACAMDSMKAAIAIADAQGRLMAANAPWKEQGLTPNPLIPPWRDGNLDYAGFCRKRVASGGEPALVAQGFLAVLAGEEARFVQDFMAGEEPGARSFGITINRFQVEGADHTCIAIADITQRVEADRELFKAIAIKNVILENSSLGISFVRDRVFEWANPRMGEILGRPMGEILGAPTRILYPDQASYDNMGRSSYPAMGRGEMVDFRWQLQRGDGSLIWCRLAGRPLDSARPSAGSVWIMEDVNERIQAEQERLSLEVQLRQAQKLEAIGQLAAGIAHEINTPTQYIGDNARFLEGGFKDVFHYLDALEAALPGGEPPEPLRLLKDEADLAFLREEIPKAIEQSMEGIERVSRIVRAMKDFSHPGSDTPVDFDLNRIIESTVTVSRNEWKYVADLVMDLDPGLGPIQCFPNELSQVVLNLIVNAAHAIADRPQGDPSAKGTITVATARAGDQVEIRVRDTGTGIPVAVRDRIFDPFFTTKTVGRGTGQGLAIVHNAIVERHRGTVTFETELGTGTVFIVRLPVARPSQP